MELIKTWRNSGFTLRLYDTYRVDSLGKCILAYELKDRRKVVFAGDDFACSPLHAVDSLHAVVSLLGFLTLRPGDTDREYFANYTPDQLDWCQSSRCEQLSMIAYDIEERINKRQ